MTEAASGALVVFQIGEQALALAVEAVECVVQAVEVSPLPGAPDGVVGIINLRGRIIPVFDLRPRLGFPARSVRTSDYFVIAHTRARPVALLVDAVEGVVAGRGLHVTPASEILPDLQSISGVMKLGEGLVVVQDIERFLSIEDHEALQLALNFNP
jgi:purine-binding chemotaxis protein CheW